MKELSHCPQCKFDFNGEDIYELFLERYSKRIDYPKTVEQVLESIKNYPEQYKDFPTEGELRKMSPAELNALETANNYGWTKKNPKCFRKEIGIEIQGVYDGTAYYQCPSCSYKWARFKWAEKYLNVLPKKSV
jgi:hypothetical protein